MDTQGFLRYDALFDVNNANDSHTITALKVGSGKKVLDVGCSVAVIAPYLRSQNCTVIGIDADVNALKVAQERCDHVYQMDLNDPEQLLRLPTDFDVILCNDVLEHIVEPDRLLRALLTRLNDDGFIIASLPNVAHGSVRLALWRGQWTYRRTGILDSTHLHFYTKSSIQELFARSGWFVAQWDCTTAPYETDLDVPLSAFPSHLLKDLDADPSAQAYQYVVKAYKRESLAVGDLLESERLEWHLERTRLEDIVASGSARIAKLEAELVNNETNSRGLLNEITELKAVIDVLGNEKERVEKQALTERSEIDKKYRSEVEMLKSRNNELTRLIATLHHQLGILRNENSTVQSDTTDIRQERDLLYQTAEQYRYLYESLRFSRAGRVAHGIGSIKSKLMVVRKIWGSPRQFFAMFSKASRVLVTEGPVQLARYGSKKLRHPELRYNESVTVLNAEEDSEGYQAWIALHRIGKDMRAKMVKDILLWAWTPTISILMPVYNVNPKWLERAVESVRQQVYPYWELCIVDDASSSALTTQHLAALQEQGDPRIKIAVRDVNGGISAATNDALAMSNGEFVALMDNDDELAEQALYRIVEALQNAPDADILYSDEDKIDEQGKRFAPFFKPDWSPTLLLGMNYVSHLGVYRRDLAESVGGFRSEYDGAQDYDFLFRCSEKANRIVHIPDVLYHWRALPTSTASVFKAKPYALNAGLNAVADHVQRLGLNAALVASPIPARNKLRWNDKNLPLLSVVIPTKDQLELLKKCLDGLIRTEYSGGLEIIVVDNGSSDPRTIEFLKDCPFKVIPCPGPFNFSSLINQGVMAATGDAVLILNNDIEILNPDWLGNMVGHLQIPGVGVVGPKLLYPDGRVQHGGIVVGLGGIAGHAFWLNPGDSPGYFGLQQIAHEVSAVTGACLLTRREIYEQVGGFREDLPVNFNDVAFCLEVRSKGHRVVYCPDATLIHHESASRASRVEPWEEERFRESYQISDPFYSPHLSLLPAHVYGLPLPNEAQFL